MDNLSFLWHHMADFLRHFVELRWKDWTMFKQSRFNKTIEALETQQMEEQFIKLGIPALFIGQCTLHHKEFQE